MSTTQSLDQNDLAMTVLRMRHSAPELAAFLREHREALLDGSLTEERMQYLNSVAPGWDSIALTDVFAGVFDEAFRRDFPELVS